MLSRVGVMSRDAMHSSRLTYISLQLISLYIHAIVHSVAGLNEEQLYKTGAKRL